MRHWQSASSVLIAYAALAGCGGPQKMTVMAVDFDVCDTDYRSSLVSISAARLGGVAMYQISREVCGPGARLGKAGDDGASGGFSLDDGTTPPADPVVILYTPDQTNLSAAENRKFGPQGMPDYMPAVAGTLDINGQVTPVISQDMLVRPRVEYTPPGAEQAMAFPSSAFGDKQAVDLYSDLSKRGVPTLLVNGHQSEADITAQSRAFFAANSGTPRVLDFGHGTQGADGMLKAASTAETMTPKQVPGGATMMERQMTPVQYNAVDKVNAVFAGADRDGYCVTIRCFGGSLADDGLNSHVKQLMTFSDDRTVSYGLPNMNQHFSDFLTTGRDVNGDRIVDLQDFQGTIQQNRDQMGIAIPKFEVRPSTFVGMQNNQPFLAVNTANPPLTATGEAKVMENQLFMIGGRPAFADLRFTPSTFNAADGSRVYQRDPQTGAYRPE